MTADERPLATEAALNTELKSLLQRAHANGVDVEGGWECRNGSEYPDWDIIVTAVRKTEDSA